MELTITIQKGRATVVLKDEKGRVVDSEEWPLPGDIRRSERRDLAREIFDDAYDNLNFAVHGYPTPE